MPCSENSDGVTPSNDKSLNWTLHDGSAKDGSLFGGCSFPPVSLQTPTLECLVDIGQEGAVVGLSDAVTSQKKAVPGLVDLFKDAGDCIIISLCPGRS